MGWGGGREGALVQSGMLLFLAKSQLNIHRPKTVVDCLRNGLKYHCLTCSKFLTIQPSMLCYKTTRRYRGASLHPIHQSLYPVLLPISNHVQSALCNCACFRPGW